MLRFHLVWDDTESILVSNVLGDSEVAILVDEAVLSLNLSSSGSHLLLKPITVGVTIGGIAKIIGLFPLGGSVQLHLGGVWKRASDDIGVGCGTAGNGISGTASTPTANILAPYGGTGAKY